MIRLTTHINAFFANGYFYTVFLFFICTLLVFQPAYATLPANTLNEYSQNNITFYDPSEDPCASGVSYTAKPNGNQITWIGDSYSTMADGYGIFSSKLPGIDFGTGSVNTPNSYIQGSKWFAGDNSSNPSGISILEDITSSGNLREYLVFALGTNGGMSNWGSTDYFQKVVDLAGPNTKIVFTTLRTLDGDNNPSTGNTYTNFNTTLRNFASYNPNVYLADWDKTVGSNISQYYSSADGIHPKDKSAFEAWFNTIYDALPGGSVGTLASNNDVEKTWNFFASANIDGVSNNPAAIAGIIGNLLVESPDFNREWGIDPFYGNGTYYGIIQDRSGHLKSAVEAAGYGGYWHTPSSRSRAPEDAVAAALQIELEYLATKYPRFVGTEGWERQGFLKNLDAPSDKNSPEAWAELFEISVEGAFATSGISSQVPNDPGVIAYNRKYFSSYSAWQGLGKRRDNARKVFDTYAGTSASVVNSSTFTTSSVPTNMTWNNGWLESGMPGLTVQDVTNYPDLGETIKSGYSTPDNKPNKILLHSTEGTTNGYDAYPVGNKYPAHFIIDLKKKEAFQNLPITNRAMSTRSSDGSTIQIEIVGFSTPANSNSSYYLQNFTASEWDYLALLLSAISEQTGIPLTTSMNWNIDYNNISNVRSTNYVDFNNNTTGIVGHMHSPDDTHIDPGNIWPMLEEAITRNPSAAQFANNSADTPCGIGTASSSVTEGGLTYDQALTLAMNYGTNKGNSSSNAMSSSLWSYCAPGRGGSNCVSFSVFFINKFTNTKVDYAPVGNGNEIVNNLAAKKGIPTGTEPQVWSVFSVGNSPGHTGVIVGYENGEWIVAHASCHRGRSGKSGRGNGKQEGSGSGFVVKSSDIHTAILGYRSHQIHYAYFGDQIDKTKLSNYLSTGE